MKKIFVFLVLLLGVLVIIQAQPTVLQFGERLPNLYYWDSNWVDSKYDSINPGSYSYNGDLSDYNMYYDRFLGRICVTDVPLKVEGIAGLVEIYIPSNGFDTSQLVFDTNRLAEFFRLYQMEDDSLYLKAEIRWDTATPQYQMTITPNGATVDLYEAYFHKPITVHDTFCIGGTTHNNLIHGYDEENFEFGWFGSYTPEHPITHYPILANCPTCVQHPQSPPYYVYKYLNPNNNVMLDTLNDTWWIMDTTLFHEHLPFVNYVIREVWLPFFAIFDANYVYSECMGVPTTGLQVEEVDTTGNVTLAWDDSGVEEWQVSVTMPGQEADSGMLYTSPINYLQLSCMDTGQWYVARVRTLCDTDIFGAWSDSVLFYVPGHPCIAPTWLHVAELDSAMVKLAWNAEDVYSWKVEIGMEEMGMTGGQLLTATTNEITVEGLYTDAWYWARVRAMCDSDYWSDWTDTIRFLVPNQHPQNPDTTNTINPIEQYTYLMPNPAKEEVTVMSSFKVRSVELYASDGKMLKAQEVNGLGTRLSLEGLPAGVYFVRVRTSAGVTTKRLVVE